MLLPSDLLTSQAAFHTGGLFLCAKRPEHAARHLLRRPLLHPSRAAASTLLFHSRMLGGIYKLLSLLTLAAVSAIRRPSPTWRRETRRDCINLHPRPAYLPRAQTLVPISINYRKLWRTHFLRVLCSLAPPPYLTGCHPSSKTSAAVFLAKFSISQRW